MKSNFTMISTEETAEKPHVKKRKVDTLFYRVLSKLTFLFRKESESITASMSDSNVQFIGCGVSSQNVHLDNNLLDLDQNLLELFPKSSINMNMLSSSRIKEHPLGAHFDEKKKKWITKSNMDNRLKTNYLASILLMLFSVLGAFAQTPIDLSLRKQIDTSTPTLNSNVKYTLWLINKGTTTASNIVVKDMFPVGGATLLSHTGGANFVFNTTTGEGNWAVASVAPNDSVELQITALVKERGVFFNTAEIFSVGAGQEDVDSTPNNSKLHEDDFAAACFSVPLYWYAGDEYTVTVPAPYNQTGTIQWMRNDVPITASTSQAVVRNDTLIIKGTGNYTFTTSVSTCPATGCCAVQIIQGPFGSIGDFVWKDADNDGVQDAGEIAVKGVILELYAVDGSGNIVGAAIQKDTTDALGAYKFDSLLTGDYKVKILSASLPTGCVLSSKQDLGGDDTKDNDFNLTTFLSPKVSINTDSTGIKKDNPTIDAALYSPLGSIGDYVWKDTDNDGIQDAGEVGVKDVIIELWASDASGNPTGTSALKKDTTDATGFYQFTNLVGGDYVVKIVTSTLPQGCTLSTKQNQGTDDTKDNDFSSTTGLSQKVTLDPTNTTDPLKKDNPTIDAALYTPPTGSIGDYVWKDSDNDGIQDASEAGVSGVVVELYTADAITGLPVGAVLKKDTTDANGKYLFSSLSAGNYVVKIVTGTLPNGCLLTSKQDIGADDTKDSDFNPSTGLSDKIVIDPNDPALKDNLTIDGGLYSPLGSIGDYVWKDADNDGIQDASEVGVKGVILELYAVDAQGNVSATAIQRDTTDVNGYYLFGNLSKGDYKVKILTASIPADCLPSDKKDQGTDDTKDSDFDITTGFSPTISIDPTVPAKKDNSTVDGAVYPTPKGSIGDYVWKDTNNNGIQDIGEAGVGNVKVELYASDANGTPTGTALQTVTTTATGYYSFTGLAKGDYVVKIVTSTLPTDCQLSDKKDQGTDDTKDSDFNPTTGTSPKISIDPVDPTKKDISTIDAAVYTPAKGSIGDYVWKDSNNNGIQDGTEAGVGNVIVQLWAANGTSPLKIDTTDASGKYLFTDLVKGDYYIKVVTSTLPTGCVLSSKKDQGTDDTKDSDFDPTTGISPIVSIDPADPTKKDNLTIDGALYSPLGSIGDYVWKDTNNNGIQDIGEAGVGNVKVELYASDANGTPTGTALQTVTTTATGYYSFTDLVKGDYVVKIVTSTLPTDCQLSDKKDQGTDDTKDSDFNPTTATSPKISIDPVDPTKKDISTIDGAVYTPAKGSIGDYVWKDSNNNGIQEATEAGVGNVIVQLWAANGTSPLKIDTTDASGKYLFTDLVKGDYYVKVVTGTLPIGCVLSSKKDQGTDDTKDSDFDPTTGISPIVSIDPADPTKKDNLTIDGALYSPLGSIGDYVWKDTNNNGIQDLGEAGVGNVKVELYASDANGTPTGTALQTVTTTTTGYYSFTGLVKGDYVVKIVTSTLPTDCQLSDKKDQGTDDTKDSDFNPTTGTSPKISIDPVDPTKKDISTIDAAVYTPIVCPQITVSISNPEICMGDTTYVKVTSASGGQINWYLSVVGGTPIETTASGEIVEATPTTTTTYYVEVVGSKGCVREPVVIVVNARPLNPTCTGVVEECIGKTVNLNDYIINGATTPGGKFEWHVSADPSSALVTNPTAVSAGTYYLFEKSGAGCYSNPTILKVVLKSCDKLIDLSLTKTSSNLSPSVGENITFTVSVKNDGPDAATNVEVKDVLPANLQFVSSSQFTNAAGTLTANVSNIAAGQTIVLNYVAKVISSAVGTNYAQVTKADQKDSDSTPGNGPTVDEDDDDKVTITPKVDEADLSLNKTVSNATPTQGDVITYFIEVKNDGPVKATNVEVKDIVPAGLTVQSTSGGDFPSVVGNTVTATFSQINLGETVTLKIIAKVTGTGTIKNWAEITKSDQKDPDSTPNNGPDKNEDDDDDADITIKTPCNPTTPIIACTNPYICLGESVIIEAVGCNGTIVWSNGQTGTSLSVSPTSTTVYTAQCKVGECLSPKSNEITIVVNSPAPPAITASATNLCGGASSTLTASGCSGTVVWSNGQTGISITVTPTTTTEYSATCKVRTCVSSPSNKIKVNVGTPGNAPVISVSKDKICAGESVTLKANGCDGTVVWSNGQNGLTIPVSPTTTTTYTAVCKVGECTSPKSTEVTVTVSPAQTPTITASKESICVGESVTLTATGCTGSLTWSTGQTTSTITVTPTATIAYDATCAGGTCNGKASKIITVTPKPTAPIVTCGAERICEGESLTFTAHNCEGTVTWSTGATGVSMTTTPAAPSTTYWATCTVNGCVSDKSKDAVITILTEKPVITASSETACAGGQVTLTANNCSGTLKWNTGETTVSIMSTVTATTTYSVTCTVEGCEGKASKIITLGTGTKPSAPTIASNKTSLCGTENAILTATGCDGIVKWSNGSTGTTITVGEGSYTATCTSSCGVSDNSNKLTISKVPAPTAPVITASKTTVCGNETVTLSVSGCNGTLSWSNSQSTSTIVVGEGTYKVKCTNSCGESSDSNTIIITPSTSMPAPSISASTTSICEAASVSLTAAGCTGTVVWSNGQTGNTISVNLAATTTFSAICKSGSCESPKSNEITITVGKPNKPTISSDNSTVCAGDAVKLTAVGCSGTVVWSNGLTGATITVNPTSTTDYTAVCKLAQGGCTSDQSNKVTITVTQKPESPTISCSASRICKGDSLTLNALGCSGSVAWNTGHTTASIIVSPAVTTVYTAICKVGSCESAPSAAATINVGNPIPPIVSCKNTVICGGGSTEIEAAGCTGTVVWSNGQKGAVITVSPTTLTSYSAICDGGTCQSEKSNVITVQVTGTGLKTPTTKDLVNTCPYTTVDLTTGVTSAVSASGGVFVFRTGTTPTSPAVSNPAAAGTGTYYVFEKAGNGCYSPAGKINVQITDCNTNGGTTCATNPATANAGKDTTICLGVNDYFTLNGKIGGAASSAKWTTDGKGTFENSLVVSTKYTFANEDIQKGSVKFTLTTNDPDDNGSCTAATSSFTLTINAVKDRPTVESNKSPNICFGDSVVLTATQTGKYLWSNGATTKSIAVKTPGVYTVKLVNDAGCHSLKSDAITVKLSDAIAAPTVTALSKNVCPATSVNLNSTVTSQLKTTNGVFEFHTGNLPTSPMLANASSVLSGTYYIFEKSSIGCYSPASQVIVSIDQCNTGGGGGGGGTTDTTAVDPSITIVGSRVEIKIGDELTYTVTVKNNSTKPATNVKIENTLPAGLTITVPAPGLTADGNILKATIPTLAAGDSKVYTYTAKLTKAGQITNTAKIVGADQTDPVTSNNISQYSVECKTCQEVCVATALAADTTRQANGSYNVTFRAFIEACGNVKLEGVKLTENLATMFPSPVTFTVIQKPTAGVGSKLKTNDSFNGTTDTNLTIPEGSIIEAGKIDTVKFVINIVPNGNEGPFSTNAQVSAIGNTIFGVPLDASDVSNNGTVIDKASAEPTVVKLFKSPSIGLAKSWADTLKKVDGSYNITYRLLVKNNGSLPLTNVVVRDTLSNVFKSPATFTVVGSATKGSGSSLQINPAFNGSTDVNITLPTSTLAVGKTDTLKFVVNVKPATVTKFSNIAVASGTGTLANGTPQTVTDVSNSGSNPDAPGSNPTDLSLGGQGQGGSINEPCVGIALAVKDTVKQSDGSYNVIYQAIIKNCGNVNLTNVQLCDTLSNTFKSPAVAQIFNKPSVNTGSTLKPNNSYDGITNTCLLASGSELAPAKADTIRWTVNVKLNDNKGPFRNNVTVTATGGTQTVSDVSNDGVNPDPSGNAATVINFNALPAALIGIAKDASTPVAVEGKANTYDVTYTLKVKNYGREDFVKVQVQDNLSQTFGDSVKIDSVKITADAGFTANSKYTGKGSLINLLVDSTSTLPKGTTRNIKLFVRVNLTNASTRTFNNAALAIGTPTSGIAVDDQSVKGDNPDPDANGTPKDNTGETPAKFGDGIIINPAVFTPLGIAKHGILDSTANADGSYNLTYKVVVRNYGTRKLTNVQLSDSLSTVFADSSDYILNGKPTLSAGSKLKLDGNFNGKDKTTFFVADSSSLAVGASDTLTFKVIVFSQKQVATFSNSIYGTAKDSTKTVADLSQSGLIPDKDTDKNPGNDSEPTLITITKDSMPLDSTATIPQAFSPNGDGNGDNWVIPQINGTNRAAEIYIYNRWGQLVYKNLDFGKEKDGWNGVANSGGLILGNKTAGVPDGTYYYCIKAEGLFGGKTLTDFITIAR